MNKKVYNDVIYKLSQASLNCITNSVVSISFLIKDNYNVNVLVYTIENISQLEKKILLILQLKIKNYLSKYVVNIEFREISIMNFKSYMYETLTYVMFLRHQDDF